MIQLKCPHCGAVGRAPDSAAGKRASCAKCSAIIPIPALPNAQSPRAPASPPVVATPPAHDPSISPADEPKGFGRRHELGSIPSSTQMGNPGLSTSVHGHHQRKESNGLGVAGFIVSLVGFFTCGFVSPFGMLFSIVALMKRPRAFAFAGTVLGLLGSVWLFTIGFSLVMGMLGSGVDLDTAIDEPERVATDAREELDNPAMSKRDDMDITVTAPKSEHVENLSSDDPAFDEQSPALVQADTDGVRLGGEYGLLERVELRDGPNAARPRKFNQKASDELRKIVYLVVDTSTTVRVLKLEGDWAEVQITQPAYLTVSHRGWIPIKALRIGKATKALRIGKATRELSGWIRHTCLLYADKSVDSRAVGYLVPPAAVTVADQGNGWLRIILAPVRHLETENLYLYLDSDAGRYIEAKNFTQVLPYKWKK